MGDPGAPGPPGPPGPPATAPPILYGPPPGKPWPAGIKSLEQNTQIYQRRYF